MAEEFMSELETTLSKMRLLAEGAISLYESNVGTLLVELRRDCRCETANALASIGDALYDLRGYIGGAQTAHSEEIIRHMDRDEPKE